ncbi:MAG TPA: 2-oxoglutarate dehydrogenase E1 component [Rhizomicrobium sp.]|jgi:2-oxoglutarate dehydrogenase E1 component|nr:2-oxoglutarate dehydrogenase E1 component [Rhizomicrobium sp.]
MTGPNSQGKFRASNAVMETTSFLSGSNTPYIEELYGRWRDNPESVDPGWAAFFAELGDQGNSTPHAASRPSSHLRPHLARDDGDLLGALTGWWPPDDHAVTSADARAAARESIRAIQLVRAYRVIGHLAANLDPLGLTPRPSLAQLDPAFYGFHESDLDRPIYINGVLGLETATPREIVGLLKRTYCGPIGYEFTHINDPVEKDWLQRRIEGPDKGIVFTPEGKRSILNKLVEAEGFEKFCALRFVGTKRFGLDGGEAMIPALEQIIKRGGQLGVKEIVLGMSHRGRLNVLANVMAKPYRQIFHEFQGGSANPSEVEGSGDVKYHLGASSDREFDGRCVHLSLSANPSHLEAVNPVVLGKARAKQQQLHDEEARASVLPLLIHGDAAFAGQGVVAECFAMSGTKGFKTGGTIHFIVNNQIGFTTAPAYARSSPYPSDVALMVQAPIFHVNGDDPEAVVHCARVATEFRELFHKDVVIDMFCYRRFGHNEADEPSFTQPLMYRAIKEHPTTLALYARQLIAEGVATDSDVQGMQHAFSSRLDSEFEGSKAHRPDRADWLDGRWTGFASAPAGDRRGETSVPAGTLQRIGHALTTAPQGFHLHRTIARQLGAKAKTLETGRGIDWATAEALAFGTLLDEGCPVRLSGQDSSRGTFSQRHAVLVDQETEERYVPLAHVGEGQAEFEVIDSLLSEEAVLGFEYGFSSAEPRALVLWEAQFGDFVNGAQVVIDQFIASGEMKWLRMCGLVLLLPHGYEGQGPEHSSARLERFLQLCAQDNIQVANCTTPANYFHILRRQIHRPFRKPLVLMTPKSLLRHKRVVSDIADMSAGAGFHRVLWDDAQAHPGSTLTLARDAEIARVILCSGKVYYDLLEDREKHGEKRIQLLRIEQLYPFPSNALVPELLRFPQAEIVWCQEEPKNQGAWTFIAPHIHAALKEVGRNNWPCYIGRAPYASTAAGLLSQHNAELHAFLDEAMTL